MEESVLISGEIIWV